MKSKFKLSLGSGIYCITCIPTGKIYIGSAVILRYRWNKHVRELQNNKHSNSHLQHAWNKYGEASFVITVLEYCDKENLLEREQYYLDTWQPFKLRGFNIARSARSPQAGRKLTPEHRARIAAGNTGKPKSAECRAKISIAHTGKKLTPEQRVRHGEIRRGIPHTPEHRAKISAALKSRPKSPEQIAKMSAANKGRKLSPEWIAKVVAGNSKHTYIITSPNGDVMEAKNLNQFARDHGLSPAGMSNVVNGRYSNHKGWTVRRKGQDET